MNANAQKVINKAASYLGVHENPMGSNTDYGGPIDRWEAFWGMRGEPWCNIFADAMYREAGVSDDGVNSPATAITADNAKRMGLVITVPIPGCLIDWYGQHIEIVTVVHSPTVVDTIGGNVADSVMRSTRSTAGTILIAPHAIRTAPVMGYWFEDPRGAVILSGAWKVHAYAQNTLNKLGALNQGAHIIARNGFWRIQLAQKFGPYIDDKTRRVWMAKRNELAKTTHDPNCNLRAYNALVTG